jgi:hypothetical protein
MTLNIPLGNIGYGNQIFIVAAGMGFSKFGITTRIISHVNNSDSVPGLLANNETTMDKIGNGGGGSLLDFKVSSNQHLGLL